MAVLLGLTLLTATIPARVQAHERVNVGKYQFIVGWADEPALVGGKNALVLGIMNMTTGSAVPVTNASNNLTAKILYGSKEFSVDSLVPTFGEPGFYHADIIPTAAGIYRLNLTGRVGSQAVSFNQDLDEVTFPSSLEFPNVRPTPENLSASSNDAATWGKIGVAVGAVGVVLGAVALAVVFKYGGRRP